MNPDDIRGSREAIFGWIWLLIAMVFSMVIVGGVTRLTGSGLSIVEWAPIMGTLPPLGEQEWMRAFEQYQQYPQFRVDHPDMTLAEFKGIFFWEYVHRLLGRAIGMVFLLPFLWFWARGCLSVRLRWALLGALLLGAYEQGKLVYAGIPAFNENSVLTALNLHHSQGARVHTNSWGDDGTTQYNSMCRGFSMYFSI